MAWIDTLDNETRAHAATKGWDRLDDAAAAQTILKSYRELERIRPAPAAVPKTAAEYTFDFGAGKTVDDEFVNFARGLALDLKLPVADANTLATKLLSWGEAAEAAEVAAQATNVAAGAEKIKAAWGAEYEAKTAVMIRGREALGMDEAAFNALGETLGVDKVMEQCYELGSKLGEAALLKGDPNVADNTPPMTRGAALQERNRLTTDPEFAKKLMAGEAEAVKKLEDLSKAIVGTPDNWQSPPENFGREHNDQGKEKAVDYTRFDTPPAPAKP